MAEEFPYEDIIGLRHPESKNHRRMSMENRAAQFAPFAALTGHDEAVAETARRTNERSELSADRMCILSRKLGFAMASAGCPELDITYFKPDEYKSGGSYVTVRGSIKKVEESYNRIILNDGTAIPMDAVIDLSGDIFNDML